MQDLFHQQYIIGLRNLPAVRSSRVPQWFLCRDSRSILFRLFRFGKEARLQP